MFSWVHRRGVFILGVVLLALIGLQTPAWAELVHRMDEPAGPNIKVHRMGEPAGSDIRVHRMGEPAGPDIKVHRVGEPAGPNIKVHRMGEPAGPDIKVHRMGEPAGADIKVHRMGLFDPMRLGTRRSSDTRRSRKIPMLNPISASTVNLPLIVESLRSPQVDETKRPDL